MVRIMNNDFKLNIPDDVMAMMVEKNILASDVEKVIEYSKRNNEHFFNPYTMQYVARLMLENVVCWVRYEEKGKELNVISVITIERKLMCYTWRFNIS